MKAICDECGLETRIRFEERQLPRGLKETYFKCEKCFVRYTAFITDGRVRRLQKDLRKITDEQERKELQNEINERMTRLRKEVT